LPKGRLFWPSMLAMLSVVAATGARGQQDLDAGKTGPQLFSQDCVACHRSPQGLVKTMSGGALNGFLRQHYTSSAASANALAAYLLSAGGPARAGQKGRPGEDQAKQRDDHAKQGTRSKAGEPAATAPAAGAPSTSRQEHLARPADAAGEQPGRPSRKGRRPPVAEPAAPAAAETASPSTSTTPAGAPEPAPTTATAAPPAAAQETPTQQASAPAPATAPPGFTEPLP